jgi:hypothetical protein
MIPNLEYTHLQGYEPGHLGVHEKYWILAEKCYIRLLSLECVCVCIYVHCLALEDMHCLFILLFHCFLFPLLGYLFTVTTYKFELTATKWITNILLIQRVQFMEIGCQGVWEWKKARNHCCIAHEMWPLRCVLVNMIDTNYTRHPALLDFFFYRWRPRHVGREW